MNTFPSLRGHREPAPKAKELMVSLTTGGSHCYEVCSRTAVTPSSKMESLRIETSAVAMLMVVLALVGEARDSALQQHSQQRMSERRGAG